jgi:hypothetical protein
MRIAVLTFFLLGILGCGTGKSASRADTLSVRQRDSILGTSRLPGAKGISGALRVSDSAAARRGREEAGGE